MVTLRAATLADRLFFYRLHCQPAVRTVSFHPQAVSWTAHTTWYAEFVHNHDILKWTVRDGKDRVGVVWVNRLNGSAEISVTINPKRHGKGLGTKAIELATHHAFTDWDIPILAWIRADNEGSVRAFTKAGFLYWGSADHQGCPASLYRYPGW